MFANDTPPIIPLWINGHAFLTLTPAFHDVRNAYNGEVLRRTPLCGPKELQMAVAAAEAALASWMRTPEDRRVSLLAALGSALVPYAEHFARLINEESGNELSRCMREVGDTTECLKKIARGNGNSGVVAVIGNRETPLLGTLRLTASALAAGAVVVVRPSIETPSALFALAELATRCGLPDGVFNIVHGDETVTAYLRSCPDVDLLVS